MYAYKHPDGKTRRKVIRTKETRTHFVDPSTAAAQLTHGCGSINTWLRLN